MKTKMKRLFGILLSLALVLGLMPGMSMKVEAAPEGNAWESNNSLPTGAGTYYLTKDVTISSRWDVPSGETTLDLNGYGIKFTGRNSSVIYVSSGRVLNLKDSGNTEHKFTYSPHVNGVNAGLANVNDSASGNYQTFTGGYITGGKGSPAPGGYNWGGAVLIEGGTFNMYGGTLIGNSVANGGGAVYLYTSLSTFNMYGGKIMYNKAQHAGALRIADGGRMTMSGGEISHNACDIDGGGVHASNSYFTMTGGVIKENVARIGGSGVYMGYLTISGTATIRDNVINRNGGNNNGAGIYAPQSLSISGNPVITGNKDDGNASNIFLKTNQKITISGELSNSTPVGVLMQTPGEFTSGTNTNYNDLTKFTSDNTSYVVIKNASNQLELVPVYTVTYAANGGSGTMTDSNSYPSGSTVTVLKNGFTAPDNYAFAGFKIESDDTIYANAEDNITGATATFTITSDTALTAQWKEIPEEKYHINIGGVSITSRKTSGEGWKYDPSTNTLTLSNFTFNGIGDAGISDPSGVVNWQGQGSIPKHDPEDFHIVLEGNNTIVEQRQDGHSCVWGIISYPNFTISGNGTLDVSTVDGEGRGAAIYAYQNLDITDGTIIATSGSVTGNQQGYGIGGGDNSVLTIGENAKVTAAGPKGGISVTVKNTTPGIGWTNTTGTDGKALIESKPSGQNLISYKKVQFPAKVANITFKVKNGAWNNDTTEDQSVTLFGREDETLKLAADQIPAVGEKPDAAYKAGTWDVTPNTETAITKDTIYTYTYAAEDAAVVKEAPKAKEDLIYTGSAQELVTAGKAEGGKMQYALGTDATTEPTEGWNADIPAATNAGTYYVWYKAVGDENHSDSTATPVTVAINKADAVAAIVTANNCTYDGTEKPLVTVTGEPTGGTMQYAIGTDATTAPTTGWAESIPTGTDAGTYYVWYYVKGDGNHTDSKPVCITVKIAGAVYTATDGEHTIGDGKDTPVTVNREPDDSKTYDLYTGAQMDGKDLPEGSHTPAKGSLVLTLKAAYLDTLTVGDHKLTIAFEDGSATATIKIKEAAPAPTATPKPVPKTGDGSNPALWLGLAVAGLILIAGTVILWDRKKRCGK